VKSLNQCLLAAVLSSGIFIPAAAAVAQPVIKPGPNGEVVLVVTFKVKPGAEADFEKAFHRSVTCSRLEPGNVTFNIHKVFGAQRTYVQYEIWRSEDALKSHFGRPFTKALLAMFDRDLSVPLARSVQFVADLDPQPRGAPATTDPASVAECQ
jgi:quinol monooxygenase YgiN